MNIKEAVENGILKKEFKFIKLEYNKNINF